MPTATSFSTPTASAVVRHWRAYCAERCMVRSEEGTRKRAATYLVGCLSYRTSGFEGGRGWRQSPPSQQRAPRNRYPCGYVVSRGTYSCPLDKARDVAPDRDMVGEGIPLVHDRQATTAETKVMADVSWSYLPHPGRGPPQSGPCRRCGAPGRSGRGMSSVGRSCRRRRY